MNRKYDLDYLQWLQQNARVYLTGMMILTLLVTVTFSIFFLPPWQTQRSIAFWNKQESDQAVVDQQIPAEQTAKDDDQQPAEAPSVQQPAATLPTTEVQAEVEQQAAGEPMPEQAESIKREETAEEQTTIQTVETVDLLALETRLEGFTIPCSGALLYGYGVGYDAQYGDYRFHDRVCYQAAGSAVVASADGIVQQVQPDGDWQLVLRCGAYQLRYQGLQDIAVTAGDGVAAGQFIGTVDNLLYVQAVAE